MKQNAKKAKMPRVFGAMFVTAAIAACAFAGTAFAADGFQADNVEGIYDDAYAKMSTEIVKADYDEGIRGVTQYDLINTNYESQWTWKSTDEYQPVVSNYGVMVYDEDADAYGLYTYTKKPLLASKYSQIVGSQKDATAMVFAVRAEEGKAIVEQYERGTSKPLDTLEVAIADKTVVPQAYIDANYTSSDFTTVGTSFEFTVSYPKGEETATTTKLVSWTEEGMTATDIAVAEGYSSSNSHVVTDGFGNTVFIGVASEKHDPDTYKTDVTTKWYLPDGTELTDLADFDSCKGNQDVANGVAATKFVFSKTTKVDGKMTTVAKLAGADGKVTATLPEQSLEAAEQGYTNADWSLFGDYAIVFAESYNYSSEKSNDNKYIVKAFNADGSEAKNFTNATRASVTDVNKKQYLYVYYQEQLGEGDEATTTSYSAYYDATLTEVAYNTIREKTVTTNDKPTAYMLDGTKLYTGAKFAFDQDGNLVKRANQYVTSIFNSLHEETGSSRHGGGIRIGSTDAFIATADNGKFGVVASDGTELAASECDKLYSQYNCNLAMAKKGDKWYFIDLSGRARAEMFRLYNQYTGEHFYTSSADERDNAVAAGWTYEEGKGWMAPGGSGDPVFRLYNEFGGEHHYTTKESERDELIAAGWTDEGVGWFSDANSNVPLLREYNPNMFSCNHNYTADLEEHAGLVELGWVNEGVAWYGLTYLEPIDDANALATETKTQSNDLAAAAL